MRRGRHNGFSALEAVIAVIILGLALSALLSWRMDLARRQDRVSALQGDATAQRNALLVLREINPMATPEGVLDLSAQTRVTWRATAVTDRARSMAYPAGDGAFDVALYRIDATVNRAGEAPIGFSFERLGWTPRDGR
ncbi:MAG: hypothetical protein NW200_03250 [Hyphomonadaceae bacterium]|nr:hypothetical protein [Hyphomonadaceae bacterium]